MTIINKKLKKGENKNEFDLYEKNVYSKNFEFSHSYLIREIKDKKEIIKNLCDLKLFNKAQKVKNNKYEIIADYGDHYHELIGYSNNLKKGKEIIKSHITWDYFF